MKKKTAEQAKKTAKEKYVDTAPFLIAPDKMKIPVKSQTWITVVSNIPKNRLYSQVPRKVRSKKKAMAKELTLSHQSRIKAAINAVAKAKKTKQGDQE